MTHVDCNIISDLLPLYVDGACSRQSVALVEEHIKTCEKCKKLYDEMNTSISAEFRQPTFEGRKLFQNVCKKLSGIVIAAAVMISCIVINAGGAWEGGPATAGELITTVIYLIFWGVFSIASRKYALFVNISYVISLLTTISSANALFWNFIGRGGFFSAFISIFTSVPFYGLRYFMGWRGLYITATIISLVWLVYTGIHLKKTERLMGKNNRR